MRGVDVAARWGGGELLTILPATGLDGARSFAERVRAAVEKLPPQVMHGATLSVGVAELQPGRGLGGRSPPRRRAVISGEGRGAEPGRLSFSRPDFFALRT